MTTTRRVWMSSLMLASVLSGPAWAAKPMDVESDFPLTIEDASPTDEGEFDARLMTRYEHTRDNDERVRLEPEFEYGLGYDTEVNVVLPFDLGSADDDHGGDLSVEFLHSFVDEQSWLPQIAASLRADAPTGENSAGLDTTVRVLATKHVFEHYGEHAVHFNAGWLHNAASADDERDDAYQFAVGTSHGLTDKTALVTDFVREQNKDADETDNMLELGLRHEVADDTIASVGLGAGIGPESPDVRITLGFQKTF